MTFTLASLWWIATGAVVATELATGRIYLLMLALGCVAGALAAHAGAPLNVQWIGALIAGGGATLVWHNVRSRTSSETPAKA